MKLPSVPTDNLYKFLAISGIIVFFLGIYTMYDTKNMMESKVDNLRLREDLNKYTFAFDTDSLSQFNNQLDQIRIEHDLGVLSKETAFYGEKLIVPFIIGMIGFVVSMTGFSLWYSKLQVHQNKIVKNDADKLTEGKIHIYKIQFEKEFEVYKELWSELSNLRNTVWYIMTIPSEDWTGKPIDDFNKYCVNSTRIFQGNKPFIPEDIYKSISELMMFSLFQSMNKFDVDSSRKELKEMNLLVDDICKKIQKRIGLVVPE